MSSQIRYNYACSFVLSVYFNSIRFFVSRELYVFLGRPINDKQCFLIVTAESAFKNSITTISWSSILSIYYDFMVALKISSSLVRSILIFFTRVSVEIRVEGGILANVLT